MKENHYHHDFRLGHAAFTVVFALPFCLKRIMDKQKQLHANAYAPWTDEEEITLCFLYRQGKTINEIALILQRNEGSIRSRLRKIGLV